MSAFKIDGSYSTAFATSKAIFSNPIPRDKNPYILKQEFIQAAASFAPLALNTPHPVSTSFVLAEESERQTAGGNLVKWTRTYVKIPASWDDWDRHLYNFIGFMGDYVSEGGQLVTAITGRDRRQKNVMSRIVHDYFLVDPTTGTTAGPGTLAAPYDSPGSIPATSALRYYYPTNANLDIDFIADSPPLTSASSPSRTAYDTWCANAISKVWTSTVAPGGAFPAQIQAEDSVLSQWMGNVWVRQTRYVLAQ
jgi:hypothetical protein